MVHVIIPRKEATAINENPGWSLVYGRRKVGKTFMIEHFIKHDIYFSVRLDRSIFCRGFIVNHMSDLEAFKDNVIGLLENEKTVVIDEFQRLPTRFLEDIAKAHPRGRLILTGSSMRVSLEILGKNSPLLGLLRPFKIGLLSSSDVLAVMGPKIGDEEAVRLVSLFMDPWTIPFYDGSGFIEAVTKMISFVVNGLIGEIFREDQRELSNTYSSILSLMGQGYSDHREIANILYSRGMVGSSASSSVLPYMKNMQTMGLLEKVGVYGSKKEYYVISSFPMRLYYYLQAKYGFAEREFEYTEIKPTVEKQLNLGIENTVANLFAQSLKGRPELLKNSEREVYVLITVRNKPKLVGEVKWGKPRSGDADKFLKKVNDFSCRKILVTKNMVNTDKIDVITANDLVEMAKKMV